MNLLAQTQLILGAAGAPSGELVTTGEAIVFWVLGPIALAGGIGMVFARNAVHSALFLVLTMMSLAVFYVVQQAPFLGFAQIIVYTGAVMMLFLFVLMLVGRDSSDSLVETLRGQRLAALALGVGLAALLVAALAPSLVSVAPAGLAESGAGSAYNVGGLGTLIFTDYLVAFELTAALLMVAALGGLVLSLAQSSAHGKRSQRATVTARLRGEHARISPLPGPGVYATANSVAVPALLPDGSIAPESLSEIIESTPVPPATYHDPSTPALPESGEEPGAAEVEGRDRR